MSVAQREITLRPPKGKVLLETDCIVVGKRKNSVEQLDLPSDFSIENY